MYKLKRLSRSSVNANNFFFIRRSRRSKSTSENDWDPVRDPGYVDEFKSYYLRYEEDDFFDEDSQIELSIAVQEEMLYFDAMNAAE